MPDPIKAMEMMNQLNLEGGNEPAAKARSTANDRNTNPETAKKFDVALDKALTEAKEFINKGPKSTPKLYSDLGPRTSGSGSGDFGSGIQKMNKDIKRNYKSGGTVSSASKRADGCAVKGKTKGKVL